MNSPGTMQYEVQDVVFAYPGGTGDARCAPVLDGVSLRIARGEYVVLLGRNGSGKSTLARLLNGLNLPLAGTVVGHGIDSRDPERVWDLRRLTGMVFEHPGQQLLGATLEEDVAFGPENLGLAPAELSARVAEALQATGLERHAARPPRLLSGGEQQRAALAGVLALRPECLVLDEATALLDPAARREVLALARELNRTAGVTVLHVTHDMEEALGADRVLVMAAGRIVRDGTPQQVFADADALQALGLELPPVAELCALLRADGVDLPAGLLDGETALAALLALGEEVPA